MHSEASTRPEADSSALAEAGLSEWPYSSHQPSGKYFQATHESGWK